jgi:hypothetical protein
LFDLFKEQQVLFFNNFLQVLKDSFELPYFIRVIIHISNFEFIPICQKELIIILDVSLKVDYFDC